MDDADDRELALVKKHVGQLMEHFETVRIFVTRHEPDEDGGKTLGLTWGGGNIYAQCGQVQEWVVKQNWHAERDAEEGRDDDE